ncbi:MAG: hypothetical protein MUC36_07750 [Planctomycetes bacterium]|nr:hypothetical protein [Planctomycetota bacterium]
MFQLTIRLTSCVLSLAITALAQCPPAGGYAPPVPGYEGPSNGGATPGAPTSPQPAGPSSPRPTTPAAPAPTKDTTTPRGPAANRPAGPRTGGRGMALSFERGATSKDRLRVRWVHPVPAERSATETSAAGPIPFQEAIQKMWDENDQRPLLVLRECSKCKDSDEAMLFRALDNERTLLLTRWFRTVRLPSHVAEAGHPFFNVFEGHGFEGGWPHFFLLAHPGAKPVTFTAAQTPSQLWKAMGEVIEQRYAKNVDKAIKEWQSLLETFDKVDARHRQLEDQLAEVRAEAGPDSARAKKLAEELKQNADERDAALAREKQVLDLGLLPMPRTVAAR